MPKTTPKKKEPVSAWLQLYIAQKTRTPSGKPTIRPGRPGRVVAWADLHMEMPQGDLKQVRDWQKRFDVLLNRKVSLGETVGLLARICTARFDVLDPNGVPDDIENLVDLMVGDDTR